MLGMGLTLSLDDFKAIGRMPGSVALGFVAQYTIMPLCGWLVATLLDLDPGLAVGIILVASCPGGMASNMITYLAKANVALSVVLGVLIRWKLPRISAAWRSPPSRCMSSGLDSAMAYRRRSAIPKRWPAR